MKWSIPCGKISGIRLYIHWTFFILIGWIFFSYYLRNQSWEEAFMGVWFILALFVCVVMHEFGHALAARRYKIVTKQITLLPIGGVAQMEKIPEKPAHELWVSVAGPLVNVGIAILLYIFLKLTSGLPSLESLTGKIDASNFLFLVYTSNVILAVFNLIPAFPMDGGRILRALLAMKVDRKTATRMAANIGQMLAIVFIFFGIFNNIWLVFIGLFIYVGAEGEARYEATKSALSGHTINDVLMHRFSPLRPDDSLQHVVDLLLDGQEKEFIVATGNEVHGVLIRNDLIKGLKTHGKDSLVENAMQKEFTPLSPDMKLEDVYMDMIKSDITIAPVFESGNLIGLVDKENIAELLLVKSAIREKQKGEAILV